jgi:hypothetical protein
LYLNEIARYALVPFSGIDFFLTIEYIELGFDYKMRFITGHFLVSFNPGIQLTFPAVSLRCS